MITVTMYVQKDNAACREAEAQLAAIQADAPHRLVKIDIAMDRHLSDRYRDIVPVLEIGPYTLKWPFKPEDLQVTLKAAQHRVDQLQKVDEDGYQVLVTRGQRMTGGDKFSLFVSSHYLLLVNLFIFIYLGLPFLAPVLMKENATLPANIIYRVYSLMCHQLAFRSFFLFGEQPYYPRELAGVPNTISYEQLTNEAQADFITARTFEGDTIAGFKVALCERDVAIYGAMVLFGIAYGMFRRKFRQIPWYAWVIIGMVPIGLDGFSQIPSAIPGLPAWIPIRESTPMLRVITGALFGGMTAWYLFPMLEQTMQDTRRVLLRKQAIIDQTGPAAAG